MPNKVITGTKAAKVQVVKGQKDIRQVRCPFCKTGLATNVPDGKGGTIYQCPNCQRKLTSTPL